MLLPFYAKVIDGVVRRVHGFRQLFFFEPGATRDLTDKSDITVRWSRYSRYGNVVYEPHVYTRTFTPRTFPMDGGYRSAVADARHLGLPLWIGEFGANPADTSTVLTAHYSEQDAFGLGGALWLWKENANDTNPTVFWGVYGPPFGPGVPQPARIRLTSRAYPLYLAGNLTQPELRRRERIAAAERELSAGCARRHCRSDGPVHPQHRLGHAPRLRRTIAGARAGRRRTARIRVPRRRQLPRVSRELVCSEPAMPHAIVHLSSLAGSPLLDSSGERLGRVEDVVARLDTGDGLPPVIGLKARIGGRELFVPIERVERLEPAAARTATTKLNLAQFERRPGEVLLRGDVLDRSLINVNSARLVTAHEVELVCEDGIWRVAGIDPSIRPRLWRLLPRRFRGHDSDHTQFVAWSDLEPFVGHVPTSRLKLAARRIVRLHPAQIADLVEAASHDEGEEILEAVGQDKELEADVFEELDDEHQVEFLKERDDEHVAAVLARMASDDAADLLLEIEQDRRIPILNLLPPAKQIKIKGLLGHNPSTAGGLMNPDLVSADAGATVNDALHRVRASELSPAQVSIVCVTDDAGALVGAVELPDLIRADGEQQLSSLIDAPTPTVPAEADLPDIALLMTDFNLIAMPVIDADGKPIGIVSVDDVLELLLPEEWRRRAGLARS